MSREHNPFCTSASFCKHPLRDLADFMLGRYGSQCNGSRDQMAIAQPTSQAFTVTGLKAKSVKYTLLRVWTCIQNLGVD